MKMWLWLGVVINVGIGLACLVDPVAMLAPVGVGALSDVGIVELRAMYGGFEIGLGGFLAWCTREPTRVRTGLVAAVMTVAGIGIVRLASWLMLQPDGWMLPFLFFIELSFVLVGVFLLRQSPTT